MSYQGSYRIPAESVLNAFESVARNGSFSRAAGELRITQSAISSRIAGLENQLSARLFERSRSGVCLTEAGHLFFEAVVTGIRTIQSGMEEIANQSNAEQVVLACSHDMSHLAVSPRYDALRDALGEEARIRLLTHQHYSEERSIDPAADVVLTWNATNVVPNAAPEDMALVFKEEVRPICSPVYAAAHADTLGGPVAGWGGLTFLDMKEPDPGWTSWLDWFEVAGDPDPAPRHEIFDSYTQVLGAAAASRGIALGRRHCVEKYIDSGRMVMLTERFVTFDNGFVALLTAKGRSNPIARKSLSFFGQPWTREIGQPVEVSGCD